LLGGPYIEAVFVNEMDGRRSSSLVGKKHKGRV
jgi:hypothetical protein